MLKLLKTEMMSIIKIKDIFFIFVPLFVFLVSCHSFQEIVELNTNLDFFENNASSVLFETKPGCSKTNFKIKDAYYELDINRYKNCIIASDFNEFENTLKTYFEMDYFKTITLEYFEKNFLVVVILSAHDDQYYKNGKFENGNDNKFVYKIELWDNGKPILLRSKCSYIKVFVINMKKIIIENGVRIYSIRQL
jgi:hypothetical protein